MPVSPLKYINHHKIKIMSNTELGYLIIGIGVGTGSVLIIIGVIEILIGIKKQ